MDYLIYHDKDLDGLACGAIAKMAFPDAELVPWDYSYKYEDLLDIVEEGTEVIMMDVSLSEEDMADLIGRCEAFTFIDHHLSAWDDLKHLSQYMANCYFKNGISACELTWDFLFPDDDMPEMIKYLGVYDTWRKENEYGLDWDDVLEVQVYFRALLFDVDLLIHWMDGDVENAAAFGHAILEFERSQFKGIVSTGKVMILDLDEEEIFLYNEEEMFSMRKTRACFITNSSVNPSRLMDYIEEDILIQCYFNFKTQMWKYSLRSKGNIDVSKLAKHYGGGGHKNAAGFSHKNLLV